MCTAGRQTQENWKPSSGFEGSDQGLFRRRAEELTSLEQYVKTYVLARVYPPGKCAKLLELYLENDLDKETYQRQKTALDVQADQLAQMRGAATRDLETVLARISSIGSVIAHGTSSQQKEALAAMFERIEVDHAGDVTHLAPRKWAAAPFDLMPKEDPASAVGSNSSLVHLVPPRGFEHFSGIVAEQLRP